MNQGIKVSWKRAYGAASYYVYRRSEQGTWTKLTVVSSGQTSYIDRKVKQGKRYYYKVRPYNNGVFGKGSSVKNTYRLNTLTEIRAKQTAGKEVAVYWKKKSGVTFYQVKYAANLQFKNARKISASRKDSSLKTKKLEKKTYYFKVRYCYKNGSTKAWSKWSNIKKVQIH